MYLFVVYFLFAPVISESIHRNVNYSDIQVLMMVIETETLTSTLNNIFTYSDHVFSATFIYICIYIYIYIYIYRTGCCPEDLPEVMSDREKWRERVRDIRATSMT